jgi:MFS family permease
MSGLLVGAAGMFATRLMMLVVVLAVAAAGWALGLVSDRYGRKRTLTAASGLLAAHLLVAFAPNFPLFLVLRGLQGSACRAS